MAANRPRHGPRRGSPGWAAQEPPHRSAEPPDRPTPGPDQRRRPAGPRRDSPEGPPALGPQGTRRYEAGAHPAGYGEAGPYQPGSARPGYDQERYGRPDPGYGRSDPYPAGYGGPGAYGGGYGESGTYGAGYYDPDPYAAGYGEPGAYGGGYGEPDPPAPSIGQRQLAAARLAAQRGRTLTRRGFARIHHAAGADGADRSGLRALTYATMANYATDAAVAVALANTLFFSAATAESRSKVALYLLITVAPFALVAPVVGPLLDRLQRGRRLALGLSFVGRAVLAVVMAVYFDDWGLYPAALGVMVLSKSYTVLRAAVTPRVLPTTITLVTTNSRMTTFGLAAGGVFGGLAAGVAQLTGSPGALVCTALLCGVGAWLCSRIPSWVEVTEGEVPAAATTIMFPRIGAGPPPPAAPSAAPPRAMQPMGRRVVVSLWGGGSIRVLTGFLTLFVAFVVKAETEHTHDPSRQLLMLGVIGAAAGVGSFVGNAMGARQRFDRSDRLTLVCVAASVLAAAAVAVFPGIPAATGCALVVAVVSALSKVCLDAVIQRDLPERSRASAFGWSETVLQLAWVLGGALGILLPPVYRVGFITVAVVVALGGVQTALVGRGGSVLPWLRYRGPG